MTLGITAAAAAGGGHMSEETQCLLDIWLGPRNSWCFRRWKLNLDGVLGEV